MKTLSFILFTLICFTSQNSYSQKTVEKDSAYVADYNTLQSLHLKELDSDIYIEYSKKLKDFLKKTNGKSPKAIKNPDDLINWIKDNIEETEFLSYTEAEFEWGIVTQLQVESTKQNQEYHSFMMQALQKHGPKIVTDEMMNTMNEYPEKFGLPAELKGKLKQD